MKTRIHTLIFVKGTLKNLGLHNRFRRFLDGEGFSRVCLGVCMHPLRARVLVAGYLKDLRTMVSYK